MNIIGINDSRNVLKMVWYEKIIKNHYMHIVESLTSFAKS